MEASWTGHARQVLERAIEVHGGGAAWRRMERLHITVRELSGVMPRLAGLRIRPEDPLAAWIEPHACRTVFEHYPLAGQRTIFERGEVRVERTGGATVALSVDHRSTFRGRSKLRRWSPMDAAYFFGYSLWHYHTLPFSLRHARVLEVDSPRSGGGATAILVDLPPAVPTHSRRQRFFFGRCGRIERHDYVADVIGPWAHAAHRWLDYEEVNGLAVAMRRTVHYRLGRRELPLVVLNARFGSGDVG